MGQQVQKAIFGLQAYEARVKRDFIRPALRNPTDLTHVLVDLKGVQVAWQGGRGRSTRGRLVKDRVVLVEQV